MSARAARLAAPVPAGAARLRARILAEARAWLGTPYVHQASAKGAGADCLGLIRGVWRALYGREPEIVPPYTPDWNERAWLSGPRREPLLEAARRRMTERAPEAAAPGDVLIFRVVCDGPAKHCGILSAPDRFIHAYAGRAVIESRLSRWWRDRLAGAFAFPGAEEDQERRPRNGPRRKDTPVRGERNEDFGPARKTSAL